MTPTIRVQPAPFDIAAEFAALTRGRTDVGGVGSFVGTVRDSAAGRPIEAMTLEHYPGMTERALAAIAADAAARYPLLGCTIVHRVGRLRPGEPIVLVLASSAHRQAALDATGFLIDWLKTAAPFWKQEHFAGGDAHWVAARSEDTVAAERRGRGNPGTPPPLHTGA
jgi:molybdopterin synthase catalytic subunit